MIDRYRKGIPYSRYRKQTLHPLRIVQLLALPREKLESSVPASSRLSELSLHSDTHGDKQICAKLILKSVMYPDVIRSSFLNSLPCTPSKTVDNSSTDEW